MSGLLVSQYPQPFTFDQAHLNLPCLCSVNRRPAELAVQLVVADVGRLPGERDGVEPAQRPAVRSQRLPGQRHADGPRPVPGQELDRPRAHLLDRANRT